MITFAGYMLLLLFIVGIGTSMLIDRWFGPRVNGWVWTGAAALLFVIGGSPIALVLALAAGNLNVRRHY